MTKWRSIVNMFDSADVHRTRRIDHNLNDKDAVTGHQERHLQTWPHSKDIHGRFLDCPSDQNLDMARSISSHSGANLTHVTSFYELAVATPVFPHWVNHESSSWQKISWLLPLKFSHIESTMSRAADKRFAGCLHSCLPTLSQQWVQLVSKDFNLATQYSAGLHTEAPPPPSLSLPAAPARRRWRVVSLVSMPGRLWGTHLWLVRLHQNPRGFCHRVCIDRHVPEHAPFAICLGVGQDDQVRFARTASQHPIDRRSGTSAPQLCLVRRACLARTRQQAIHKSLHPHRLDGCVVLLESFIIGQLHVIEGHQGSHETSFHFNTNQSQLDIDLQHVQRCHGTASVQLAVRVFPLQRARLDDSARSAGPPTRLQMTALQLQRLLIIW